MRYICNFRMNFLINHCNERFRINIISKATWGSSDRREALLPLKQAVYKKLTISMFLLNFPFHDNRNSILISSELQVLEAEL